MVSVEKEPSQTWHGKPGRWREGLPISHSFGWGAGGDLLTPSTMDPLDVIRAPDHVSNCVFLPLQASSSVVPVFPAQLLWPLLM